MSIMGQRLVNEADTGLSELVDRVERGEEITIVRAGRPVARLIPAARTHDVEAAQAAEDAILELRERIRQESGTFTTEEILSSIREGRKY